jgi:hypothetical protein
VPKPHRCTGEKADRLRLITIIVSVTTIVVLGALCITTLGKYKIIALFGSTK